MLRNLSSQPLTALKPEFQKQIKSFLGKVQQGTRPKQMMGRVLTGEMMVTLIRSYAGALNSGGVPVISSAWERVLATQCQEARSAAQDQYDEEMKANLKKASQRFHSQEVGWNHFFFLIRNSHFNFSLFPSCFQFRTTCFYRCTMPRKSTPRQSFGQRYDIFYFIY